MAVGESAEKDSEKGCLAPVKDKPETCACQIGCSLGGGDYKKRRENQLNRRGYIEWESSLLISEIHQAVQHLLCKYDTSTQDNEEGNDTHIALIKSMEHGHENLDEKLESIRTYSRQHHDQGRTMNIAAQVTIGRYGEGHEDTSDVNQLGSEEQQIKACLNPNIGWAEALERLNGIESINHMTEIPNTKPYEFDIEFEEEEAEGGETDLCSTEGLFILQDEDKEEYQSMAAELSFEDLDGQAHSLPAIIDSGAARCCLRKDTLDKYFPQHAKRLQPTDKRFHDASKSIMPVRGTITIEFWIGKCKLNCQMFVFDKLSVPILIGTSALMRNGLIINAKERTLYTTTTDNQPQCSVPLQCTRNDQVKPHILLASDTMEPTPGQSPISQTKRIQEARLSWTTTAKVTEDIRIIAGKQAKGVLLTFENHCPNTKATLELEPTKELLALFPTLETAGATLQSASNAQAFIHLRSTEDIVIPKGTIMVNVKIAPERATTLKTMQRVQLIIDQNLPFEEGGPPTTAEHLKELGLDLSTSIDPNRPKKDGGYELLTEAQRNQLIQPALRWWWVWSRDARVPEVSRLVVIDIPTGDAIPVAQKPYPIPYQYRDAVIDELRKLLHGGLIEPTISQWASPLLVRLKKDSTPDKIRLKCIIDYRRLNQVTLADAAGLGDMEEILDGFGGKQRYGGICDAAGGFYQFTIKPEDRSKTAFVLPTSMGGTSFQWRVAPYGLTRNPAGYSRGMMFALQGLHTVSLAPMGNSTGGCSSWIDDISMHADSFDGFVDLFERVLMRMASASMQLKASKCLLLQEKLEVLGFFITPDGIVMQETKLKDLNKFDENGNRVAPASVEEIRTFLGAVQFYRRFVPRISLLAAPMIEMLRKSPDPKKATWDGVRQSFDAILTFLQSDAIISAPDLSDPLAEYVICTDACDIAAGGVLLQWQHPSGKGGGPPPGTPLRGGKGTDPLTQSWRHDHGWKLRTIAYYSKTFDKAQKNYPTFDKESAAILFCVRKWAKLITCKATTLYTDSSVAASMLHKHMGPPRLQRWGMELGTFLPYLKVAYRKGTENGMADFLSRYPAYKHYISTARNIQEMPSELFDKLPEMVPMFTHKLGDDEEWLSRATYELYEAKNPRLMDQIWQHNDETDASTQEDLDSSHHMRNYVERELTNVDKLFQGGSDESQLTSLLHETRLAVLDGDYWKDQQSFNNHCGEWEHYAAIFHSTNHRSPVVYDLCCGEGGFSRGARITGAEIYGVDKNSRFKLRYETDFDEDGSQHPSGMSFMAHDVSDEKLWDTLMETGNLNGWPPPDIIHISPPCRTLTRLRQVRRQDSTTDLTVNYAISKLKTLERHWKLQGKHLIWQVENVPESRIHVTETVQNTVTLCGTMMGHKVFRHRTFYCNYTAAIELPHSHHGKWVGSNGVRFSPADDHHRYGHLPPPNMYGVYSSPSGGRGTLAEWHGAMGFPLNTFSSKGIANALPISYGRLLTAQMIAHSLHRTYGCPIWTPSERDQLQTETLANWTVSGYHPNNIACARLTPEALTQNLSEGMLPVLTPIEEEALPLDADEDNATADGISSTFDCSRAAQLLDPHLNLIIRKLESEHTAKTDLKGLKMNWIMDGDRLWRLATTLDGEPTNRLAIPLQGRGPLLRNYHHKCHRGGDPLYREMAEHFYWPNMEGDCHDFANACVICSSTRSRALVKAEVKPIPTPSRPFNVIHLDHKGPLPRSGPYLHILVVTCALTRFTLYIPVTSTTAEETLKILMARIFCVFGYPLVIVSDNGPAFRNSMMEHMATFFGYRHVHILPYNAQANGTAEASVKRIKLLLDRHCKGYAEWHKILPLAQLQLNTHIHSGTKVSPFMALFGRAPTGIAILENPALLPQLGTGTEFMTELRAKLIRLHVELQEESDNIKKARADEANSRRGNNNKQRTGIITPGSWIRILRGSTQDAEYIRKHGHGQPWKFKYKVLEVTPHSVRLVIPKDGSVPAIGEWQLIRRCEPSVEAEIHASPSDPKLTEAGIPMQPLEGVVPPDDGSTIYEIERVLSASKVGNRYKLLIQWKGYSEPTYEWKSDITSQTMNDELLHEITTAIDRCKESAHSLRNEDEDPTDTPLIEDSPTLEILPGKRVRRKPDRYTDTSVKLLHEYDPSMLHAIYVHQQACMQIASYNPTNP